MGVQPRVSIEMEGDGLVRLMGRLSALEVNTSPTAQALAGTEMMSELEKYTNSRWGEGVVVTDSTLIRWPSWQPLENTGALRDSLTKPDAEGAVRNIVPGVGFEWGTSIFYAKFLSKGTRKMTPKPVIRDLRAIRALMGYYMRRYVLRGTGI